MFFHVPKTMKTMYYLHKDEGFLKVCRGFMSPSYDVHRFTRPNEAIEAVRETQPDVFMMNTRLYDRDWLVFAKQLYELRPEMPVIIATNGGDVHPLILAKRGEEHNICGTIYPVELGTLCSKVDRILARMPVASQQKS